MYLYIRVARKRCPELKDVQIRGPTSFPGTSKNFAEIRIFLQYWKISVEFARWRTFSVGFGTSLNSPGIEEIKTNISELWYIENNRMILD